MHMNGTKSYKFLNADCSSVKKKDFQSGLRIKQDAINF